MLIYKHKIGCLNYTAVYDAVERNGLHQALAFNDIGMHEHTTAMRGRHLGKRVPFTSLPEHLQRLIVWGGK